MLGSPPTAVLVVLAESAGSQGITLVQIIMLPLCLGKRLCSIDSHHLLTGQCHKKYVSSPLMLFIPFYGGFWTPICPSLNRAATDT